jgi:uncharacterized protein (TIGR02001 family)
MKRKIATVVWLAFAITSPLISIAGEIDSAESPHAYSANIGLFSQYIWRGMTQTAQKPAVQVGVDYEHASGLYAGAWASNVSWLRDGDASLYQSGGTVEMDLYAGFASELGDTGIGYDLGVIQYIYPGSEGSGNPAANATELFAELSYGWVSGKYSHTISSDAWGFDDAKGTAYYELNADIPLGETDYVLNLHVGSFKFDGNDNDQFDYDDWKVGVSRGWDNGINIGGYWTDNNANTSDGWVKQMTKSQFTVFVQKVF